MAAVEEVNINKIFIENLPRHWSMEEVAQNCSTVGRVMRVNFVKSKTGESTGKAVVTFEEESSVDKAVIQLNNSVADLAIIKVRPFMDKKGSSPRNEKSKLKRRVYLMNLPYDIVEEHIRLLVKEFAEIEDVVIPRNKDGLPTGYAFVYLKNEEDVENIKKYVDGRHLRGRKISVKDSLVSSNSNKSVNSLGAGLGSSLSDLLKEEDTDDGIDYDQKYKSILGYLDHLASKAFLFSGDSFEGKASSSIDNTELSSLLQYYAKNSYQQGKENGSFEDFYRSFVLEIRRSSEYHKVRFVAAMKEKEKEDRTKQILDKKYPTLARINKLVDRFNEQRIFTSERVSSTNS